MVQIIADLHRVSKFVKYAAQAQNQTQLRSDLNYNKGPNNPLEPPQSRT